MSEKVFGRSSDGNLEGRSAHGALQDLPSGRKWGHGPGNTLKGVEVISEGVDQLANGVFLEQFDSEQLANFGSRGAGAGVTGKELALLGEL